MRVIASPDAVKLVRSQGGRLYVWPRSGRCCAHGLAWLETGAGPDARWAFDPVPVDGFDLFLARMGRVPDELHVPHLLLHERHFVLRPLADLAPELVHPTLYRTVRELLDELDDPHEVRPSATPRHWFDLS